jgi:hypothetical protein
LPDPRLGVLLRPDPATCLVQSQINTVLVQQFGIVSSAAFPPHVTLVGSLRTTASIDELIRALNEELARTAPFTVHNKGIERSGDGWVFNVHEDGAGRPNADLVDLANRVNAAVTPLAIEHDDYLTPTFAPDRFRGHLSLASHDLSVDGHLTDEIGRFLSGLPLEPPAVFLADTVTLFEFTSDDWREEWWHSLRWRHLHSWELTESTRP